MIFNTKTAVLQNRRCFERRGVEITAESAGRRCKEKAAGAVRAMDGEEGILEYTGVPVWQNFDSYKE